MKILSVVIPTYNMEKYLANCLDSFIYDDKVDNIEVLIVNDGSKDNSVNIAKEYEKKFPKIFKLIDKENGGHGSTINAGLKVAKGKYFKVVDADDWVDTSEFKKLLDFLKGSDVDCVYSNFTHIYEQKGDSTELMDKCKGRENLECKITDIESLDFAMHSFVFKTEKIKNIRMQEHCFYVDVEYNIYAFSQCETIKFLPLNVYQYRLGRPGQSVSHQGFLKHRENHTTVIKNILKFYDQNRDKIVPYIEKYISTVINSQYAFYMFIYFLDKNTILELIDFDSWLKDNYLEFYEKSGTNAIVRQLRKNNFKKIKNVYRWFKFKRAIKKLLGKD